MFARTMRFKEGFSWSKVEKYHATLSDKKKLEKKSRKGVEKSSLLFHFLILEHYSLPDSLKF